MRPGRGNVKDPPGDTDCKRHALGQADDSPLGRWPGDPATLDGKGVATAAERTAAKARRNDVRKLERRHRGGRMETLWGLARHAGGNVVIGPSLIVGAMCLTIRSCWKSRDHRANVDRVCATFESKEGELPGFDLASALVALHRPGSNGPQSCSKLL